MANELARIDMRDLSDMQSVCSIQVTDRESAAKVYNAMNNPSHRIGDMVGKTIEVKDLFIEIIELENEQSGELEQAPRIVLIDTKGEAYQAVSKGVFNSLKNLMSIPYIGSPTWEPALKLKVENVNLGKGRTMLTLNMVG